MKPKTSFWTYFVGFVSLFLLLGILVLLGYALKYFIVIFSGLQKEVAATIIAAVTTVIVSVISLVIGKYLERKLSIEQDIRKRKIPMYQEFIKFWFDLLMANKGDISEDEMTAFFSKFTQNLLIWGSDDVVRKWSEYRKNITYNDNLTNPSPNVMFDFEELLILIRKDMGHKNKQISKGVLLSLFINDIDKYLT